MKSKRLLAVLLSLMLIACCMPTSVFAAETPNIKPISFSSVMKSASKAHKAQSTNGESFSDVDKYLKNSTKAANQISDMEVLQVLSPHQAKSVSVKQAKEDIDLYFRVLESSYGAYYYFGTDKFAKAKKEMLAWADYQSGQITPDMISEALVDNLSFVRDAHFWAGDAWREGTKDRFYHYYYSTVRSYAKDDNGYYTYVKGSKQKWYVKSFTDKRVSLEKTLLPNGTVVYAPTLLCTESTAKNCNVNIRAKDGRTKRLKVVFTESEPYDIRKGDRDFNKVTDDGLAYISIRTFNNRSGADFASFEKSGKDLRKAKLIIFDIRSNNGGDNRHALNWVKNFSGTSPSVNEIQANRGSKINDYLGQRIDLGKFNTYKIKGNFISNDVPIIVLVDNMCGSSGESMMHYLNCLENVVVIGSNSAGYQICGNVHGYSLPNSGMPFDFGWSLIQVYKTKNVDYKGYAPDVWCNPADALECVEALLERNAHKKDFNEFFEKIELSMPQHTIQLKFGNFEPNNPGTGLGSGRGTHKLTVLIDGQPSDNFTVESDNPQIAVCTKTTGGNFNVRVTGHGECNIIVKCENDTASFRWYSA